MKNKGFSMVELIIVIAIMAILAGVLTPALIKYIHKSRLSTDVNMGREIAMAIMSCVVNDNVRDNAVEHATPQPVSDMDGSDFKKEVYDTLGVTDIKGKSKKDADGNEFDVDKRCFYYTLDSNKNKVEVYYGGITEDYQVYPKAGSKLVK
ncbi:MAG: prepilin-type N-terminal cleavage/methylation domain-containing protein [Lachnospiraceae bacterium]|nr:prepilin-type N-terminal cleavage/methylation domain-containing protein [Lachnospiraceae bacterium]